MHTGLSELSTCDQNDQRDDHPYPASFGCAITTAITTNPLRHQPPRSSVDTLRSEFGVVSSRSVYGAEQLLHLWSTIIDEPIE